MATMHPSRARRLTRRRWERIAVEVLAASSLTFAGIAAAEKPVAAVYKERDLGFFYRSSTYYYPCHELQQRVANVLLAVGARDDMEVTARNCDRFLTAQDPNRDGVDPWERPNRWHRSDPTARFGRAATGREQAAQVRIRVAVPVEATSKVLAELDKDRSRRELVSRVTGDPGAALEPAVFPAQRQQVTLSRRSIHLQPEDCELLEQLAVQVLRRLDMRVVRRSFNCTPGELSNIPPQMTVETLLPAHSALATPAPPEDSEPPEEPAAATGEQSTPAAETPPQ